MRLVKPSDIRLTEDTSFNNIVGYYDDITHGIMGNYFQVL